MNETNLSIEQYTTPIAIGVFQLKDGTEEWFVPGFETSQQQDSPIEAIPEAQRFTLTQFPQPEQQVVAVWFIFDSSEAAEALSESTIEWTKTTLGIDKPGMLVNENLTTPF